jgi:hypothetical protein
MNKITVSSEINAPVSKVWDYWTSPQHVQEWNFASNDWHCPNGSSRFEAGGEFHYIMAAKDGSVNFDFWGTFVKIVLLKSIDIVLGDGRELSITFEETHDGTIVTQLFELEEVNSLELQQMGWQTILNNFKEYVESN